MENNDTAEEKQICQSAVGLQKCLKNLAQKIMTKVSEDDFIQMYKKCYGEFEKKNEIEKPALGGSSTEAKKYYSQFNSMVLKSIFVAIDQTVLSINDKLEELENLKRSHENNLVVWRPPGNASQHMIPFEYLCELDTKKEMQKEIKIEQEALKILKTRIVQKRAKAIECHKKLLSSISNIESLITTKSSDYVQT